MSWLKLVVSAGWFEVVDSKVAEELAEVFVRSENEMDAVLEVGALVSGLLGVGRLVVVGEDVNVSSRLKDGSVGEAGSEGGATVGINEKVSFASQLRP